MSTFKIDGETYAVSSDGKILRQVKVGPEDWNSYSWTPVQEPEKVFEVENPEFIVGDMPKIPFDQLMFVREFFRRVYEEHRSEAFVYFSYDKEKRAYDVIVPETQVASAGDVTFDGYIAKFCTECFVGTAHHTQEECSVCAGKEFKEAALAGTMHSHGSMAAFHSATDDANELDFTGFHITLGKLDQDVNLEIAHSFVVAHSSVKDNNGQGVRYKQSLEISDLIEFPFPERGQLYDRWVSLVVSRAAIEAQDDEFPILVVKNQVYSMCGDTEIYGRMTSNLVSGGSAKEADVQTCTASEVVKALKEASQTKTKSSYASGSTQYSQAGYRHTPYGQVNASRTTGGNTLVQYTGGQSQSNTVVGSTTTQTSTSKSGTTSEGLFPWTKSAVKIRTEKHIVSISDDGVVKVERSFASQSPMKQSINFFHYLSKGKDLHEKVALTKFAFFEMSDLLCGSMFVGTEELKGFEDLAKFFASVVDDVLGNPTEFVNSTAKKQVNGGISCAKILENQLNSFAYGEYESGADAKSQVVTFFCLMYAMQELVKEASLRDSLPSMQIRELVDLLKECSWDAVKLDKFMCKPKKADKKQASGAKN